MSNTAIIICHIISGKTSGGWDVNWTDMHTCRCLYRDRQTGVLLKLDKRQRKQPNLKKKKKTGTKRRKEGYAIATF